MEALILAMIIAYAVKKAAESAHEHWQGAKSANRASTRGRPARQRAASAARHDAGYWAKQVRGGFPQVRHGLYMGWHAGRVAQLEGWQVRAKAKADHAHLRARVTEAVREQRRRQAEALERIRAAAAASPGRPGEAGAPESPPPDPGDEALPYLRRGVPPPWDPQSPPSPSPTEGTAMSGDSSYTQQMAELEAMRRDAEEEVNSTRRKRMTSRLDILQGMGLDAATLAEAAAIDDALQAQEKTAQQTLDAVDAAIDGLKKRHGGIKAATDDAPVDKPAEPEFYQD